MVKSQNKKKKTLKKDKGGNKVKKGISCIIIMVTLCVFFPIGYVIGAEKVSRPQEIEEGIYEIYTGVSGTKVIDIAGGSKKDGANVDIYERGNQGNQKIRIKKNEDGTYTLIALHSNKVLDVEGSGKKNGTNVCQYKNYGGEGQKWYMEPCGEGYYHIISKVNGLYLDVTGGLGRDGQNIEVWRGNGGKGQKFKLVKEITRGEKTIENGIYYLKAGVAENRLLEVPNSETRNEEEIRIGAKNEKANQKFQVMYNQDGTYTITALHSGKALDVRYGSGKNKGIIQQYGKHGKDSQKWIIVKNSDNTYSIIAKCSGLAIDVEAGSTKVGAKVQTYRYHGNKSQKFRFQACEAETGSQSVEDGTYRILSRGNVNQVMTVEGGSIANGAKIRLNENVKNSSQQKFAIEYIGNGYYKIRGKKSNKVLTVESANPRVGSEVKQEEDKNADSQKWILKKYKEGVYGIISKCGNLYVNVENGQEIRLRGETDLKEQQFVLVNETVRNKGKQIENGVYQIVTKGNKVIDIAGGSYKNVGNALIWNNTKVQQQKYQITRIGNTEYYKIIAVHSGKSLDIEGGNTNPGANVIQYTYGGTANQQWIIKEVGEGYYEIISKESGLCLDVTGGQISKAGANLELWYHNGADAQKFKFIPIHLVNQGTYEIETKLDTNKVVDIASASQQEGGNAVIWNGGNVNHERFTLEAISTDTYKIIAKHSNKALTVNTHSNNVQQNTYTGTENQKWQVKPAGNGYYYFICKANGLALDVKEGLAQNGQNVQVYPLHYGNAQKFRLVTGIRKFYQEGTYGQSGLAVKGDKRGSYLKYYQYGKGSNVLFATFSIHGFEDAYYHDEAELTYIAEEFKKYLDNHIDESIVNHWTIYIFPQLNPDGQTYGWTNNGPGRNTLYSEAPANKGIDMNRNWSVGYKRETSDRNYNGTAAFQAYEAKALRDFILTHQGNNKNIVVDTHGWLNETIGDNHLGSYYRNQFGLPNHIHSYGSGYFINWARTLKNGRSVLVELPEVTSHSQVLSRNYAQKYIQATMQMLREN